MATYTKQLLSASQFGKQIAIGQSSGPGNTVHMASSVSSDIDEIWLYATNNGTNTLPLNILWGGTTVTDLVSGSISPGTGRNLVVDGKILQNGNTVSAYTSSSGTLVMDGFVNRISTVVDPRITDWAARVVRNGGATPSLATQQALSTFVVTLSSTGVMTAMIAMVCHVPDSLIAATTPIIPGPGVDPWTNFNFVSGDLNINGLIGDGASKYLNTGVVAINSIMTSTNAGMTCYSYSTPPVTSGYALGSGGVANSSQFAIYPNTAGQVNGYLWRFVNVNTDDAVGTTTPGAGYYSLNRTSASQLDIYFARSNVTHSSIASATGAQTGSIEPTYAVAGHAINAIGSVVAFSVMRLSFLALHQGLTSTQSLNFFNSIQSLRIALGGGYA